MIHNDSAILSKFCKYEDNIATWTDTNGIDYKLTIEEGKKILIFNRQYANIGSELQSTVSKWYVTLRNIALVISMSILVYVGIRMMLTSIAAEKAKYKNMLMDWVVGIALLFVIQYIMVFSTKLVEFFIDFIDASGVEYYAMIEIPSNKEKDVLTVLNNKDEYFYRVGNEIQRNDAGNAFLQWPTNLMGIARVNAQVNKDSSLSYIGYVLVFLVLVFYTLFFAFTYMKRVIYMAFLTVIAPMVAMTYSIDKINDGKAQAFNMWLKEYIFNLMIQPFHLLLYAVLISSAIELAKQSVLYSLVAIGFLIPAEKILRKFFGFDKAQTPGFLGGAAGAALTMSAVGSLNRFARGGGHGNSEKDDDGASKDYIRQKLPGNSFSMDGIGNGDIQKHSEGKGGEQTKALRVANNNPSQSGNKDSNAEAKGSEPLREIFPADVERQHSQRQLPPSSGDAEGTIAEPENQNAVVPYSGNMPAEQDTFEDDFIDSERAQLPESSWYEKPDLPVLETTGTFKDESEVFSADALEDETEVFSADALEDAFGIDKDYKLPKEPLEETKMDIINKDIEAQKKLQEKAERKAIRQRTRAAANYYRQQQNKADFKRIKNKLGRNVANIPSKMIKGAAKFYGGALLGGIGLAAGIASGDPNNVLKMGGTGIATGSALGAGIYNRTGIDKIGKLDLNKMEDIRRMGLGDLEYTRRKNKEIDKNFMQDPASRSLYNGKFSGFNDEEVTAVMERSFKYKDKGLTDDKTIIELIKKEKEIYGEKGKDFITNNKNGIDGYVESLAGFVKDIKAPKDIDRVADGLDRNQNLSDAHKERIIQDLYDITGFKRVK